MKARHIVGSILGLGLALFSARLLFPAFFEDQGCDDSEPTGEWQIAAFEDARARSESRCSERKLDCRFRLYVEGDGGISVAVFPVAETLFDGCTATSGGSETLIYDARGKFLRSESWIH